MRLKTQIGIRLPLVAGFGILLALMAFANWDALRALGRIHFRSEQIRQDYLSRNRALTRIRSGLYLAGTYMRDYLIETDPAKEELHRSGLEDIHTRMDAALKLYARSLAGERAAKPFRELQAEVEDYWNALDPVFRWRPEERQARRQKFLREELMPHRDAVLRLATKISALNDQELTEGNRRVTAVYVGQRDRLIWIGVATLALGVLVAVMAVYEILRLDREERLRHQEVLRAQTELKRLSAKLLKAQEDERRAISRELHDEVGQSLSALLMEVGHLSATAPVEGEQFRGRLDSIKQLADSSVKEVRSMALLLRPSMLDDLGLIPALEWQAREASKRTDMQIEVHADEQADSLPDDHKTCIYRLVQEALHNCSRHAEAKSVHIDLRSKPEAVSLTIRDDGKGFDSSRTRGLGLLGMEERVKGLGGTLKIESRPGHGTTLSIELPVKTSS